MESNRSQNGSDDPAGPDDDPIASLRKAIARIGEVKTYIAQYIAARSDLLKLKARRIMVIGVLGALGAIIGLVAIVVATGLLLSGLAGAIAAGLGGRQWAGELIVGGGLLLLVAIGAAIGVGLYFRSSRKSTVARYERKLLQQRKAFGHDARQRSVNATSR